jgi:hypothetical protein
MMNTTSFTNFFDHCVGSWKTERTYHYLTRNEVERSRTEFTIAPLTVELKNKVLRDNQYSLEKDLENQFQVLMEIMKQKQKRRGEVQHKGDD